jgi:hypothetical protein
MPTLDKIDKERKLELVRGSAFVTKEEVLTLQNQMSNDPEFHPMFFQVADFG